MVCVAQYLAARFLPYNEMKEQFEFWLLFYPSAEFIPSYFLAFPITDDFFSYSFLSLLIFLLLSYHPAFFSDIFNFCFLEKIPNYLFSSFVSFFHMLSILLSLICAMKHSHSSYILQNTDTLRYELL